MKNYISMLIPCLKNYTQYLQRISEFERKSKVHFRCLTYLVFVSTCVPNRDQRRTEASLYCRPPCIARLYIPQLLGRSRLNDPSKRLQCSSVIVQGPTAVAHKRALLLYICL